ncbi:MAG: ABC transporter ATP-binding protein [Ruminococcaceae bacterium]|nr:ABC transporter ATP-binding protein [Oscillospiraceae bacterium]
MRYVFQFLRPHVPRMILGFLVKFTGTIVELALPMILSFMIDDIVPTGNKNLIYLWGGVMLLCTVIALVGNITANRMAARVARNTTEKLRSTLFTRISYLSSRQVDAFTIPSLESRLTSDTYNIHQMIGMLQRLGVRAPILLIGGIMVTIMMEPVMTMVLIATLPLITIVVYSVSRRGIPLYKALQESIDRMTRVVRENAQGIRVIKALTKEESEKERFHEANADLTKREMTSSLTMAITNPMMNLFMNIGLVVVIVVGAYRVNGGYSEPGIILAFMTYFTLISTAMMSITRMFIMVSRGTASASRIAEVLDTPADMAVEEADPNLVIPADAPAIEFRNVTFSYNGKKNDLENVNFKLSQGGTLGIIGPTGAGKSTLIQLLMRFYDPTEGQVLIGGRDVRTIPREELAAKFGGAFQSDFLFADTISENIDFGRGLSEEQIKQAAERAQAMPFIQEKEGGFAHELTIKGANLSGGQKQRMLISRALAGDPEILVLDDSSSALDYATDAALRKAIRENYAGKTTSVIVAQRVSSVRHAELILVLEDGVVTGAGNHDQLMESCTLYREISDSQMGGAILD